MRKNKLIRGNLSRVLAVASAMMFSFTAEAAPLVEGTKEYYQQTVTETTEETDGKNAETAGTSTDGETGKDDSEPEESKQESSAEPGSEESKAPEKETAAPEESKDAEAPSAGTDDKTESGVTTEPVEGEKPTEAGEPTETGESTASEEPTEAEESTEAEGTTENEKPAVSESEITEEETTAAAEEETSAAEEETSAALEETTAAEEETAAAEEETAAAEEETAAAEEETTAATEETTAAVEETTVAAETLPPVAETIPELTPELLAALNSMIATMEESGPDTSWYLHADGYTKEETGYYVTDSEGHKSLVQNQYIQIQIQEDGKTKNKIIYVGDDGQKDPSKTGWQELDGGWRYFNSDGYLAVSGEKTIQRNDYLFDDKGFMVYGLVEKDGNQYYYDRDAGKRVNKTNLEIDGKYYNADANGVLTQAPDQTEVQLGDHYYDIKDGVGTVVTNRLLTITDSTGSHGIYVDGDGNRVTSSLQVVDGKTYYFDADGLQVTSATEKKIGDYYYNINSDGEADKIFSTMLTTESGTLYVDETGATVTGQVVFWEGKMFCAGSDGYLQTNVDQIKLDGFYYSLGADGAAVKLTNCFVTENDRKRYVNEDGVVTLDKFVEVDGKKYYVDASGYMVTGAYAEKDGHTFYLGEDGVLWIRRWIEDERGFRYVNGKGYVVMGSTQRVGSSYGTFDAAGYWTAVEQVFFETELGDGTVVQMFSGKDGNVVKNADKQMYCFVPNGDGTLHCYLSDATWTSLTEASVTDTWMRDYRINAQGNLITNAAEAVDGFYYSFDAEGHGTLITYSVRYALDGGTNSSANPEAYTGDALEISLAAPTRNGYTFDGWYADAALTIPVTAIVSKNNGNDLTVYAKWTAVQAPVINNSGSGSHSDRDDRNDAAASTGQTTGQTTQPTTETPAQTTGQQTSQTPAQTPEQEAAKSTNAAEVAAAVSGQSVTVSTGQAAVAATVSQTTEGSINGNTIVSAATQAPVTVAEGVTASVATVAVAADGSARSLLAPETLGVTIKQETITVQGVAVTQNVVVYSDGTQVMQRSGAAELEGFSEAVVSAEKAIQSGLGLVAVYNDKVSIDLSSYAQVGTAVTYAVTAGAEAAASQTQMEQTSFAEGQEIVALITDANGNVSAATIVVGAGGVLQYQIPSMNCIVRFLQPVG